ncbi:hypothetical protein C0Q70_06366 [Pomacea canaliculata]|uniref:Uncharacterized protein n=1 Tax=Pomacea canaliculata TaxID=400727 RepID=A0A2T7PNT4_POMCA|nr:hypothetical protein C0Q70_06366 [Pomacea canaliculata]
MRSLDQEMASAPIYTVECCQALSDHPQFLRKAFVWKPGSDEPPRRISPPGKNICAAGFTLAGGVPVIKYSKDSRPPVRDSVKSQPLTSGVGGARLHCIISIIVSSVRTDDKMITSPWPGDRRVVTVEGTSRHRN